MARKPRAIPAPLHVVGHCRRPREVLLRTTALRAAVLTVFAAPAALAQPAMSAHPTGGEVMGGQAHISTQGSTTTIAQSSARAAINWQNFDVGSSQTVQFVQPNAQAVTLNTVLSADPSLIAGRILANGQVVLVNQSGVVFFRGAQVNVASLVASAAGITTQNFMAGKMVFDQTPHPGAMISNAGNLTVSQAGLAALVAPRVANSGVITARLGRVILGGASTYSLDLYGDGLLALNVTGQVRQIDLGGQSVTALVTNTGTILADGGTVVLSAAAADGLIHSLVTAGGTISAQSVGAQTGRILVQGVGGGVDIEGDVSAVGAAPGTVGGQVVATASGTVSVAPGAVLDASGDAGGGMVAVGTTAARAIGGRAVASTLTAQAVTIALGGTVRADAVTRGNGGRITVLSTRILQTQGLVTARGGVNGGDGGTLNIATLGTLTLDGAMDAGAPFGNGGQVQASAMDVVIKGPLGPSHSSDGGESHGAYWEVDAVGSTADTGTISVQTTTNTPIFTNNLAGLILNASSAIDFTAESVLDVAYQPNQQAAPTLLPLWLIAGGSGITLSNAIIKASNIIFSTSGTISQTSAGTLSAQTLTFAKDGDNLGLGLGDTPPGTPTSIDLLGTANAFQTLSAVTSGAVNGYMVVFDHSSLVVKAPIVAQGPIDLETSGAMSDLIVDASLTGTANPNQANVDIAGVTLKSDDAKVEIAADVTGASSITGIAGVTLNAGTRLIVDDGFYADGGASLTASAPTIDLSSGGTLETSAPSGTIALQATKLVLSAITGNTTTNGSITTGATGLVGIAASGANSAFTVDVGGNSPTVVYTDLRYVETGTLALGSLDGTTPANASVRVAASAPITGEDFPTLRLIATDAVTVDSAVSVGTIGLSGSSFVIGVHAMLGDGTGFVAFTTPTLALKVSDLDKDAGGRIADFISTGDTLVLGSLDGTTPSSASLAIDASLLATNESDSPTVLGLFANGPITQSTTATAALGAAGSPVSIFGSTTAATSPANPGNISLSNSANYITQIIGIDQIAGSGLIAGDNAANISINDLSDLTIKAALHAGTSVSVTAAALTIEAGVGAVISTGVESGDFVSLTTLGDPSNAMDHGDITEISNSLTLGSIVTSTLTAMSYGQIDLGSSGNSLTTINALRADDTLAQPMPQQVNLTDTLFNGATETLLQPTSGVSSSGTIAAPNGNVTLTTVEGHLLILGTVEASPQAGSNAGTIVLSADDGIAEMPFAINEIGTLSAVELMAKSSFGSVLLNALVDGNSPNTITNLGPSSAAGDFALSVGATLNATTQTLNIVGPVTAGTLSHPSTLSIELAGGASAFSTLDVMPSPGALSSNGTVILQADRFLFDGPVIASGPGVVGLDFYYTPMAGTFTYDTLANNSTLDTASFANISSNAIFFGWHGVGAGGDPILDALSNAPGLDLATAISAAGTLGLFSLGNISQETGAGITAGAGTTLSLVGQAGVGTGPGYARLQTGPNTLTTLGAFYTQGDFLFTNNASLTVAGPVENRSTTAGSIAIALNGVGDLGITGDITNLNMSLSSPEQAILLATGQGGGNANGSITQTLSSVISAASGDVSITASGGSFTQISSYVTASGAGSMAGTIVVTADGDISQSAGTIYAAGDVIANAGRDILQSGSVMYADRDVYATAGRSIQQLETSTISAGGSVTANATLDITQNTSTISAIQDISVTATRSVSQTASIMSAVMGSISLVADNTPSQMFGLTQSNASSIIAGGTVSILSAGQINQGAGASLIESHNGDVLIYLDGTTTLGAFTQLQGNRIQSDIGTIAIDSPSDGLQFGGEIVAGSISGASYTPSANGAVLLQAGGGNVSEAVGPAGTMPTGVVLSPVLAVGATGSVTLNTPNMLLTGPVTNSGTNTPLTFGPPTMIENQLGRLLTSGDGGTVTLPGQSSATTFTTYAGGDLVLVADARAFNRGGFAAQDGALLIGPSGSITAGGSIALSLYGSLVETDATLSAQGNIDLSASANVSPTGQPVFSYFSIVQRSGTVTSLSGTLGVVADDLISQSAGSTLSAAANLAATAGVQVAQVNSTIEGGGNVQIAAYSDSGTLGVTQSGSVIKSDSASVAITSEGDVHQLGGSVTRAPGDVTIILDGAAPTNSVLDAGQFAQTATDLVDSVSGSIGIYTSHGGQRIGGALSAPLVVLRADAGTISEAAQNATLFTGAIQAGSLAVQAMHGDVLLDTPNNTASDIAADNRFGRLLTTADPASIGTFSASTLAGGTLSINDDAAALGAPLVFGIVGSTQGSISAGSGATLTVLGDVSEMNASLADQSGGVTITASNGITQAASTITARAGDITLIAQGTNIEQTGSTVTAASGNILADAATDIGQTNSSFLASASVFATAGLTLAQSASRIDAQGGDVVLRASSAGGTLGLVQKSASLIAADLGSVSIASNGAVMQSGGSTITGAGDVTLWLTGLSAAAGQFAQAADGNTITSGTATLGIDSALGSLSFGGLLSGTTVLLRADAGLITETVPGASAATGAIRAPIFGVQATKGDVLLDTPNNQFETLLTTADAGTISLTSLIATTGIGTQTSMIGTVSTLAGGMLSLTDTPPSGILDIGMRSGAQGGILADAGFTLSLLGALQQTNASLGAQSGGLTITASSGITQSASTLTAALGDIVLSASGGNVDQTGSRIAAQQGNVTVTAAGNVAQSDSVIQASAARLNGPAGLVGHAGNTATTGTGAVTINAGGDITQSSGASIIGDGAVTLLLPGVLAGNGLFSQDGPADLVQSGTTLGIQSQRGNLSIGGTLAAPTVLLLANAGAIGETTTGAIDAADLAVQATQGDVILGSTSVHVNGNKIQTLLDAADGVSIDGLKVSTGAGGKFSLSDGVAVTDIQNLSIGGSGAPAAPITAGDGIALNVSGDFTATNADLVATSGDISITTHGAIAQVGGALTAANGKVALDAQTGRLSLGGAVSGQTVAIASSGDTTLSGLLSGDRIDFVDLTGTITWSGATIATSGNLPNATAAVPLSQWLTASNGAAGIFVQAKGLTLNRASISPLGTARSTTLDIDLANAQSMVNFGPGLNAPSTQLLLQLNGGKASGSFIVAGLTVDTSTANPGVLAVEGVIHGFGGPLAASVANVTGQPLLNLSLNGCPLTSTDCVLLSPFVLPVYNPIEDITLAKSRRREDEEFLLPDVAKEDF